MDTRCHARPCQFAHTRTFWGTLDPGGENGRVHPKGPRPSRSPFHIGNSLTIHCTDLSPLSYVAGMLIGNPAIRVWVLTPPTPLPPISPGSSLSKTTTATGLLPNRLGLAVHPPSPAHFVSPLSDTPRSTSGIASPAISEIFEPLISPSTPATSVRDDEDCTKMTFAYPPLGTTMEEMSAPRALRATGTTPLPLVSKEHLGILNGTAFSAGLATLVVRNTETIGVLGAV